MGVSRTLTQCRTFLKKFSSKTKVVCKLCPACRSSPCNDAGIEPMNSLVKKKRVELCMRIRVQGGGDSGIKLFTEPDSPSSFPPHQVGLHISKFNCARRYTFGHWSSHTAPTMKQMPWKCCAAWKCRYEFHPIHLQLRTITIPPQWARIDKI